MDRNGPTDIFPIVFLGLCFAKMLLVGEKGEGLWQTTSTTNCCITTIPAIRKHFRSRTPHNADESEVTSIMSTPSLSGFPAWSTLGVQLLCRYPQAWWNKRPRAFVGKLLSWELTYPISRHVWRWFPFPKAEYVSCRLEGNYSCTLCVTGSYPATNLFASEKQNTIFGIHISIHI